MKWVCWLFGHRWCIGAMYAPRICRRCKIIHPNDRPRNWPTLVMDADSNVQLGSDYSLTNVTADRPPEPGDILR